MATVVAVVMFAIGNRFAALTCDSAGSSDSQSRTLRPMPICVCTPTYITSLPWGLPMNLASERLCAVWNVWENADHLARLQAAEAGVRVAQAALERVLNGARPEERREAAAAVTEAEALAGLSDREAARQQGLAEQKLVSHQSLDAANSEARAARARLERARRHLDLVEAPPREDERAQAEAELAVAQARAAETRAIYEKSLIRSPLQGLVLHRFRRAGEQVTELGDTPILSVGDTSVLRVRAEVDEADLGLIALGRPAWCRAEAWGERRFTGRVSRLGSLMGRKRVHDEQPGERVDTRVMEILIDLDPGSDLPVGLRVDAFIELEAGR